MHQSKKAIILVNTGTPNSYKISDVRTYLFQFLNDKRIIDIPWLLRKILVNLIIVPFRAPNSAKLYKKLWTSNGSPLLVNLNNLIVKLQKNTNSSVDIYGVMRYGKPSLKKQLTSIGKINYEEIVILPLYPQYATSTTESVFDVVKKAQKKEKIHFNIRLIKQFYNHPAFIHAYSKQILSHNPQTFNHIIFSYHGLPNRQVNKIHPKTDNTSCNCTQKMPTYGEYCYKATCYETSRLLGKAIGLNSDNYTTTFQSRLSKNWLTPFTDETLINLAKKRKKRILIAAPSFVADCLETTIELGHEYQNLFIQHGGRELTLIKSLNDMDEWADAITEITGITQT